MDIQVIMGSVPHELAAELDRNLVSALTTEREVGTYGDLAILTRGDDGGLAGGLVGFTSYGWLLIKILWVSPAFRGQGLGTRLMAAAERAACEAGCHGAWLDTSSLEAEQFYLRRGYDPFGVLVNAPDQLPPGHRRVFLSKALAFQ